MMSDYVFISYSRKDQTYARELVTDLRASGFEVWIDDRIDFGSRWWQTIVEAVRGCTALIVVMPRGYTYRETSLDDMRAVYRKIIRRKSFWLRAAMLCFGLGVAAFAILILTVSLARF